jgi:hypothetical protein
MLKITSASWIQELCILILGRRPNWMMQCQQSHESVIVMSSAVSWSKKFPRNSTSSRSQCFIVTFGSRCYAWNATVVLSEFDRPSCSKCHKHVNGLRLMREQSQLGLVIAKEYHILN